MTSPLATGSKLCMLQLVAGEANASAAHQQLGSDFTRKVLFWRHSVVNIHGIHGACRSKGPCRVHGFRLCATLLCVALSRRPLAAPAPSAIPAPTVPSVPIHSSRCCVWKQAILPLCQARIKIPTVEAKPKAKSSLAHGVGLVRTSWSPLRLLQLVTRRAAQPALHVLRLFLSCPVLLACHAWRHLEQGCLDPRFAICAIHELQIESCRYGTWKGVIWW